MRTERKTVDFDHDDDREKQEEFLQALRESRAGIYACILSLLANRSDAEEVFHETIVVMWSRYLEMASPHNFTAWGSSIARNVVRQYVRRERRRGRVFLSEDHMAQVAKVHDGSAELLELQESLLHDCLSRLPHKDRALLLECYGPGISIRGLAERVGRSQEWLYTKVRRLRHRLFECVNRRIGGRR